MMDVAARSRSYAIRPGREAQGGRTVGTVNTSPSLRHEALR